jgi:hypothetical protein
MGQADCQFLSPGGSEIAGFHDGAQSVARAL